MATKLERLHVALELLESTYITNDRAERERDEAVRHLTHCIRLECGQPVEPKPLCDWCAETPTQVHNFEYEINGETTKFSFCGTDCREDYEQENLIDPPPPQHDKR